MNNNNEGHIKDDKSNWMLFEIDIKIKEDKVRSAYQYLSLLRLSFREL